MMALRLLVVLALFASLPGWARAHALGVQCKLVDKTLQLEAYFDDDTPAAKAQVQVFDSEKREVLKGVTDAEGRWSAPAPPSGKYQVVVDAGAGHRTTQPIAIGAANRSKRDQPLGSGPTRAEFTEFPWLKAGLGLGTIAVVAIAFLVARRGAKPNP